MLFRLVHTLFWCFLHLNLNEETTAKTISHFGLGRSAGFVHACIFLSVLIRQFVWKVETLNSTTMVYSTRVAMPQIATQKPRAEKIPIVLINGQNRSCVRDTACCLILF